MFQILTLHIRSKTWILGETHIGRSTTGNKAINNRLQPGSGAKRTDRGRKREQRENIMIAESS